MTSSHRRLINAGGFVGAAMMMAYALYAEHQLLLEPCPLCIFQRYATVALGLVFLVAALHHPGGAGRRVYAALIAVFGAGGVAIAAWHVRIQNLPAEEVPGCGPGFDYMMDAFPLTETLPMIFQGSGECGTVDWQLLGLSMPAWVAISLAVLTVAGVTVNLRSAK